MAAARGQRCARERYHRLTGGSTNIRSRRCFSLGMERRNTECFELVRKTRENPPTYDGNSTVFQSIISKNRNILAVDWFCRFRPFRKSVTPLGIRKFLFNSRGMQKNFARKREFRQSVSNEVSLNWSLLSSMQRAVSQYHRYLDTSYRILSNRGAGPSLFRSLCGVPEYSRKPVLFSKTYPKERFLRTRLSEGCPFIVRSPCGVPE